MMGKAMQCGFLGMIFLASGTSALKCHSGNYIVDADSKGNIKGSATTPDGLVVNCSNACMEAQLKFSVAESVMLLTYRGCADKEDKDGKGHVTTDNPHFITLYNESYCSRDLCNNNMNSFHFFPTSPAPEESGSNHCYAGITYDSKWNPKGVTCRKGYDQCYSGNASITVGFAIAPVFIKTCSRSNCAESQTLSFSPMMKIKQLGSCCLGNYCNGAETDARSHGKETVVMSHGKETVASCWFSFFALCAISLGGALLY